MSPVLWHVVRATGLDKEASEDVVQNTWLTLVRRQGNWAVFWPVARSQR